MSTKKNQPPMSRVEVKVFLARCKMTGREFCEKHGINVNSFRSWMNGDDTMPRVSQKIFDAVKGYEYPIELITDPPQFNAEASA